jgi:hypothetical protein
MAVFERGGQHNDEPKKVTEPFKPTKGAKMREINHNNLNYGGGPQEMASIRVEANGTNHMVNYVLDGSPAVTLPPGQKLTFPLKPTVGAKRILQMDLQYSAHGTYTVTVENIPNCVIGMGTNECPTASPYNDFQIGTVLNFVFFTE